MATAAIELQVAKKQLVKILLVEDDPDTADVLKGWLEDLGCTVDLAENPEQAKTFLADDIYQLIIVDQVFARPQPEGDEFIIQNEALMRGARKVILTGQGKDRIAFEKELERRGVLILNKGEDSANRWIEETTNVMLAEQKQNLLARIQEALPGILRSDSRLSQLPVDPSPAGGTARLLGKTQEILIGWLKTRKEPDLKGILYGGRELSPNTLVREIEEGTEIGRAFSDMFLELIRYRLSG